MKVYQGAWATLILGGLSLLLFQQFFFSITAAISSILAGIHSIGMIKEHKKYIKGWIPIGIGFFLAALGLLVQAMAWWLASYTPV